MPAVGAGRKEPKVDAMSVDFQRRADGRISSTIRLTGWTGKATEEVFRAMGLDENILRGLRLVTEESDDSEPAATEDA